MLPVISALLAFVASLLRSQASLRLEHLALRHPLAVYTQTVHRPRLRPTDRLFWAWLARLWPEWQRALAFVQPRRVVHFHITAHPTAQWTAQQVIEAFPWDEAPRYLLRDRDCIYSHRFQRRVRIMGIEEVLTTLRSPWQNPYVERLIGSIRRDCLDHVIVLHERHLQRILTSYFLYYHAWRTHLSLAMDCPKAHPVAPPEAGRVIAIPEVGGLQHHYERQAA
jgi:transposase InsO family protein